MDRIKQLISVPLLSIAFVLAATGAARAEKHATNACGCYGEGDSCTCEKNARCGCPGECEPKGCEAKRQKQLQREIDAETKRAKAEDKARKLKEQAKPKQDISHVAASENEDKGKSSSAKAMAASQKKQLLKLLEAYLAEHPESANKTLSQVRSELR